MYKLPDFTEQNQEKVIAFIKENPFAIITGFSKNYPVATHLPLEIKVGEDRELFFSGHMMKNTDHQKAFEKNDNVLVIFNGPHCYVSASWYSYPKTASTWNYITIHAKGKISFTNEQGTYKAIKTITDKYEGAVTNAAFNSLSDEYINHMLKAIIGFTIKTESLENVFKLSQNKDEFSQKSIIKELEKRGDENSIKIAEEMKKRLST